MQLKVLKKRVYTLIALIACISFCLFYEKISTKEVHWSHEVDVLQDRKQSFRAETENDLLNNKIVSSDEFKRERGSDKSCPGYWELRDINFRDRNLAHQLCQSQAAYTMLDKKFPPCEISANLPPQLLSALRNTAMRTYIENTITNRTVTIYTYPRDDVVSGFVLSTHSWEPEQVFVTLSIAKKFPAKSVTFMDIGCNIGVYTLQAREAGIPTVAVDANIRNLIRIRMSANDMGWESDGSLKLMWMYFHDSVSLQYLSFGTSMCNVGGGGSTKDVITDTIPVMTGRADDLLSSVTTDLVVMKIDIETSEYTFFSTGQELFNKKKVIAVQMEFWRTNASVPSNTSPNFRNISEFFSQRGYTLFSMRSPFEAVNLNTFVDWDGIWVRNDFSAMVWNKPLY